MDTPWGTALIVVAPDMDVPPVLAAGGTCPIATGTVCSAMELPLRVVSNDTHWVPCFAMTTRIISPRSAEGQSRRAREAVLREVQHNVLGKNVA